MQRTSVIDLSVIAIAYIGSILLASNHALILIGEWNVSTILTLFGILIIHQIPLASLLLILAYRLNQTRQAQRKGTQNDSENAQRVSQKSYRP